MVSKEGMAADGIFASILKEEMEFTNGDPSIFFIIKQEVVGYV